MKKFIGSMLLILGFTAVTAAFASDKPIVDIEIDSQFKNKNIIFIPDINSEEIGIHVSGGNLMSHLVVDPITVPDGTSPNFVVQAFVTDAITNTTQRFVSLNQYQLKKGDRIALSFPIMFKAT